MLKRRTFPVRITGAVVVSFLFIFALFVISRRTAAAPPAHPGATATPAAMGVPQPARYAALLAKARQGPLQESYGEPPAATTRGGAPVFALPPANDVGANTFQGSYRAAAKTSFVSGPVQTFQDLNVVFGPLPDDSQMAQQFPALLQKTNNATARVPLEKKNIKIAAWIYWLAPESDHDFHVILGNTAQLTSTTVFMHSEVSGLPKANPSQSPFPQRRTDCARSSPSIKTSTDCSTRP